MYYNDFLKRLSNRFSDRINEIDPEFNFDIGNEFEIHLAELFEQILPNKYGVCRGFVTPKTGESKGDDIIIFDHLKFPYLKPHSAPKFTIKESIPVESVYAYIEVKNTIEISNTNSGTYWGKALNQTSAVKGIDRDKTLNSELVEGVTLGQGFDIPQRDGFPDYHNPMFTCVFTRGIRENGTLITGAEEIKQKLIGLCFGLNPPDLIVVGNEVAVFPVVQNGNNQILKSPFYISGQTTLAVVKMEEVAFGFGISMLLWAVENIKIKSVNWKEVLEEVITNQ